MKKIPQINTANPKINSDKLIYLHMYHTYKGTHVQKLDKFRYILEKAHKSHRSYVKNIHHQNPD